MTSGRPGSGKSLVKLPDGSDFWVEVKTKRQPYAPNGEFTVDSLPESETFALDVLSLRRMLRSPRTFLWAWDLPRRPIHLFTLARLMQCRWHKRFDREVEARGGGTVSKGKVLLDLREANYQVSFEDPALNEQRPRWPPSSREPRFRSARWR